MESVVVIDHGTFSCKFGFSGTDHPMELQTVVGKANHNDCSFGVGAGKLVYDVNLKYPIKNCVMENWDAMELLWDEIFSSSLKISPNNQPIFASEFCLNPTSSREKMVEIMFEKYKVPAFYAAKQAPLALYANGKTSGIVLDCGETITRSIPVYEGIQLSHAIRQIEMGGRHITENMIRMHNERGFCVGIMPEFVNDVKHDLGYVALDFEQEMEISKTSTATEKSYEFPDGSVITFAEERFRMAESLFQPSLVDKGTKGIHNILFESISNYDKDIDLDRYSNIVLSGGGSMFSGICERLKKELAILAPHSNPQIAASSSRNHNTWLGGSILAGLLDVNASFIVPKEYNETGATIIHQKC